MSESSDSILRAMRGFEGSAEIADARKAEIERDPRLAGILPPPGEPARRWNVSKTKAMFAFVQVSGTTPIARPDDMDEADPAIVAGLAGSQF
ncbi:hypothetical protein [Falsiroseomonas sp. CW058]|uniref:hypothetical protein n=1 Tax=Falsiroseomonas sp. CW058 TaxID=3388664 RepID=UPI003D31A521